MFVVCMKVCLFSQGNCIGMMEVVELSVHTVTTGVYCAHAGLVKLHNNPFKSIIKDRRRE